MQREITGLRWVKALTGRPGCVPVGKPRGIKAKGVRFEGACATQWPEAAHGVWWEYEDSNGHGYAQTDLLWRQGGGVIIGEAKLTWRWEAYVQLRKLYFPLLQGAFGVPVGGVVICRNVTRETPRAEVVGNLSEALDRAREGRMIPTLHVPLL